MEILKNKKRFLVALIILVIALTIFFPLQKQTAIYALNKYLIHKNISSEDVYKVQILKDYKSARGGYQMFVKFVQEMNLVYVYRYSLESNQICVSIIYENKKLENLAGGTDIGCYLDDGKEQIMPVYEPEYYSESSSMRYTIINYIKDLFNEKLIFHIE